jgi:hypothetical protein
MRLMILLIGWFWIAVARFFSIYVQKYQTKFSCILIKSDKPNSKSLNEKFRNGLMGQRHRIL